jgi:hypothetical protein
MKLIGVALGAAARRRVGMGLFSGLSAATASP